MLLPKNCGREDAEIEVNKAGFTQWNTLEVIDRSERRFEIKMAGSGCGACSFWVLKSAAGAAPRINLDECEDRLEVC